MDTDNTANNPVVSADSKSPFGNIPFVELYFASLDKTKGQSVAIPLMDYRTSYGGGETVANTDGRGEVPTNRLYLLSMTHTIKVAETTSGNMMTLQILDPGWDFLTQITCTEFSQNDTFSVRYGWRGLDDNRAATRVEIPFFIQDVSAELVPMKGAIVTIHGVDGSYALEDRPVHYAYPETWTISDVISDVLRKEGFIPVVAEIPIAVGKLNMTNGMTPADYIESLLKVAQGPDGTTQFQAYVRLSSIMGQPEFVIIPINKLTSRFRKRYVFGRDRVGSMLSFNPIMNHKLLLTNGAGKTTAICVDPETKRWFKITSTQESDVPEGDKRSVPTPQEPTVIIESPFPKFQTQALTTNLRQYADSLQWEATAVVVGDTELLPNEYIAILVLKGGSSFEKVEYLTPEDIYWFATGLWYIREVTHTISEPTGFQTTLRLSRYGGFVGKGEVTIPNPFDFTAQIQKVGQYDDNMAEVTSIINPGEGETKTAVSSLQSVLDFITSFIGAS
jgi:hypothetical protein